MSPRRVCFFLALLQGLWIYLLVLWGYIVLDMFIYPQYQFLGISAYIPIPQNIIADIAFPLSFASFVLWKYAGKIYSDQRSG